MLTPPSFQSRYLAISADILLPEIVVNRWGYTTINALVSDFCIDLFHGNGQSDGGDKHVSTMEQTRFTRTESVQFLQRIQPVEQYR